MSPIKRTLKIGNRLYEQTLPDPRVKGEPTYGEGGWTEPKVPKWAVPEKGSVEERCLKTLRPSGQYHHNEHELKRALVEAIEKYPPEWIDVICKWVGEKNRKGFYISLKGLITALNNEDWRDRWSKKQGLEVDESKGYE